MLCFLYAVFFPYRSSSLTRLELLPNELLLEILSYVSISDLFYGWLNLNERFNIILDNLFIEASYDDEPTYSRWQRYSRSNSTDDAPLRYFASQLISLQTHKCDDSAMYDKLNIFDYPNLRLLKLSQPTAAHLHVIEEHNFRYLEHLSLGKTTDFSFEILCQFKFLRSFEVKSLKIDDKYSSSSSSIRSLILHDCDPSNLIYLLHHLPQMNFLKIFIFWTKKLVDKFDTTAVFIHPNLKSLHISMFNLDSSQNAINYDRCEVLSVLLAHMSPHKRIRCRMSLYFMSNFNFEQLQDTVMKFHFFRFSCRLSYSITFHSLPNFDRIRQLPLFSQLKSFENSSGVADSYYLPWTNMCHGLLK